MTAQRALSLSNGIEDLRRNLTARMMRLDSGTPAETACQVAERLRLANTHADTTKAASDVTTLADRTDRPR